MLRLGELIAPTGRWYIFYSRNWWNSVATASIGLLHSKGSIASISFWKRTRQSAKVAHDQPAREKPTVMSRLLSEQLIWLEY